MWFVKKGITNFGVWLKFDDNSSESLENFQSNLLMLESEIKNNVEKNQPFVIMGDWNADLERGRRFDIIFKDFVNNTDLIISDDLDSQKMVDVKICNDNNNSSDHLPITIKVFDDLGVKDESNQLIKKFHSFDWNCSAFIDKYNENLEKMIPEMEHYFTNESNLELINQFYKELCGTLKRAARTLIIKNMFSNRANWNGKKLTTQL
ncbi:unnamed protein product, partial [Brachionus calyciflorus]